MYIQFDYDRTYLKNNINLTEEKLSELICLKIISFRQLNSRRIKIVIIVITLGGVVSFSNLKSVKGMGLPVQLPPMERFQPSYHQSFEMEIAKIIARKNTRIVYKSL